MSVLSGKHAYIRNTHRRIAVFDWDNTLIPTTHMFKTDSTITTKQLANIGTMIYQILHKYITLYGQENMFIVTNASQQWVYYSLHSLNNIYKQRVSLSNFQTRTYFEAISDLLLHRNIQIFSAKHIYSQQFPNQTTLWKSLVFKRIVTDKFILSQTIADIDPNINSVKYSILSIGDSMDEFNASSHAKCMLNETYKIELNNVILHRIKLKHFPTLNELQNQMKLILSLANILYEEISVSQTIDYEKELQKRVHSIPV